MDRLQCSSDELSSGCSDIQKTSFLKQAHALEFKAPPTDGECLWEAVACVLKRPLLPQWSCSLQPPPTPTSLISQLEGVRQRTTNGNRNTSYLKDGDPAGVHNHLRLLKTQGQLSPPIITHTVYPRMSLLLVVQCIYSKGREKSITLVNICSSLLFCL